MATDLPRLVMQLLACTTAGEAKPIVDELVRQLCVITGLELHPPLFLDEHATVTAQGKAVSPTTAAQCAEDVERTRIFMQGVYAAIQQKRQDNNYQLNYQPIDVLYAGTGLFGLLLIPLLPLFDTAQLRVTLLDIHAESLEKLQCLIRFLGVQRFVVRLEQVMQQFYSARTLVDIEHWLATNGRLGAQQVEHTNHAIRHFIENKYHSLSTGCELPLSEAQLAHWHEQGYLIVPGVLSPSG